MRVDSRASLPSVVRSHRDDALASVSRTRSDLAEPDNPAAIQPRVSALADSLPRSDPLSGAQTLAPHDLA
jgi:hypothetical protein